MKKVEETYYCDCCGQVFNPNRSEFLSKDAVSDHSRIGFKFLMPRLVMNDEVFDTYTRYKSIEINDICDECMNKLVDFTEDFFKLEED